MSGINSAAINVNPTATVNGTTTMAGDTLWIIVHDNALAQAELVQFVVQNNGDSFSTIAQGMVNAINHDTMLQNLGVTASNANAVITLTSSSHNATQYTADVSQGSETITFGSASAAIATNAGVAVSPSTLQFSSNAQLTLGSNLATMMNGSPEHGNDIHFYRLGMPPDYGPKI